MKGSAHTSVARRDPRNVVSTTTCGRHASLDVAGPRNEVSIVLSPSTIPAFQSAAGSEDLLSDPPGEEHAALDGLCDPPAAYASEARNIIRALTITVSPMTSVTVATSSIAGAFILF